LLWLLDDDNLRGLEEVAQYLGLQVSPGIVMDLASAQYGADARVAFASLYGEHAITKNFMLRTLFPEAHEVLARGTERKRLESESAGRSSTEWLVDIQKTGQRRKA